jgi:hypothetical protein
LNLIDLLLDVRKSYVLRALNRVQHFRNIINTVKPVYTERGYNESYRFHRSHRFSYKLIGYNENSFLTKAFDRTDLSVINGFNCIEF